MTEQHPTIPQIVRALTTIDDRRKDSIRALRAEHAAETKKLRDSIDTLDRALLYRDCLVDELETVIATLCSRIERTQNQLKHDNQQCVYSEPLELMNLLGRKSDPGPLINDARSRARRAKNEELERQEKAASGPEVCQYACTHPERAHGPVGCTRPGCRCKAPNKKPCGTQFDAGPCAGTWLHRGDCTPNADDIVGQVEDEAMEAKCRICGHDDGRHGHTLPEEGRKPQCFECSWADENHEFDGTKAQETDVCNCGCVRRHHTDGQCSLCPGDSERSWRHEFFMAPLEDQSLAAKERASGSPLL